MNTLSVFHIYNVLSHKKKYYFWISKLHRRTCSANVINLCILHICLYIYLVCVDLWLALASFVRSFCLFVWFFGCIWSLSHKHNIDCIDACNAPAQHTHTHSTPLMQFSFNHELMKLCAIVLFLLNNSTLWCTSEWTWICTLFRFDKFWRGKRLGCLMYNVYGEKCMKTIVALPLSLSLSHSYVTPVDVLWIYNCQRCAMNSHSVASVADPNGIKRVHHRKIYARLSVWVCVYHCIHKNAVHIGKSNCLFAVSL